MNVLVLNYLYDLHMQAPWLIHEDSSSSSPWRSVKFFDPLGPIPNLVLLSYKVKMDFISYNPLGVVFHHYTGHKMIYLSISFALALRTYDSQWLYA